MKFTKSLDCENYTFLSSELENNLTLNAFASA